VVEDIPRMPLLTWALMVFLLHPAILTRDRMALALKNAAMELLSINTNVWLAPLSQFLVPPTCNWKSKTEDLLRQYSQSTATFTAIGLVFIPMLLASTSEHMPSRLSVGEAATESTIGSPKTHGELVGENQVSSEFNLVNAHSTRLCIPAPQTPHHEAHTYYISNDLIRINSYNLN
jgi:hypothetical protein